MKTLLTVCALASLTLLCSGCFSPSYDLHVYASPQFAEELRVVPAMEMDVIPVNYNESKQLDIYDLNEYFQAGNPLRNTLPHATICFADDDVLPKRMKGSHPLWGMAGKREARTLCFLVNLPLPAVKGGLPVQDTRRVSFIMERSWFGWHSPDKYIIVTPSGLVIQDNKPKNDSKVEVKEINIMELEQ